MRHVERVYPRNKGESVGKDGKRVDERVAEIINGIPSILKIRASEWTCRTGRWYEVIDQDKEFLGMAGKKVA
ncbi:hypothetical protein KM043_008381 [Ampulex compressa]|nr:hypothetical protein KM043_008381 [Ampulex compressa]